MDSNQRLVNLISLKKSQLYFTKARRVLIQNSGVKAGGERLVWSLASLADSLINVRSYSVSFMTFLTFN